MKQRKPLFTILKYAGIIAIAYFFTNPYYLFPDGQGYFSYLSSLFHDGDIQLFNDFIQMRIQAPLALTSTGYISNNWPAGTAIFWAPFYLTAKFFAEEGLGNFNRWYWLFTSFGTIFYGMLGFSLLHKILKAEGEKTGMALLLVCLAFFGTPAFYYTFIITSTAHGITAFAATLFIWYWLYSMNEPEKPWRYILLGTLLGLVTMVRPQEALFGLVIPAEFIVRLVKRETGFAKVVKPAGLSILGFIIGLSPQLILWHLINGSIFAVPAKFNVSLKYFDIKNLLFSPYHGILLWTPVYFTAFAGLIFGIFRKPKIYIGLVLVFIAQVVTNACCIAFWEGYSFGLRQMTSLLPVAVLGIMEFIRTAYSKDIPCPIRKEDCKSGNPVVRVLAWAAVVVPALWTMGLVAGTYYGLDLLGYVSFRDLLHIQKTVLLGLAELPGKLLMIERPGFGEFTTMLIAGALFYWIALRIKALMERRKLKAAAIVFFAMLIAFNIIIVRAHLNKPAYVIPQDQVVTQQDMDNFFIKQVEEIKLKYGIR